MKQRRIYLVTGCGSVVLIIGLLLWPITDHLMPHWPPISNRAKLRREAIALYRQYQGEGAVPRSQWPEQIAALDPFLVTAYDGKIEIMIPVVAPVGHLGDMMSGRITSGGLMMASPNIIPTMCETNI